MHDSETWPVLASDIETQVSLSLKVNERVSTTFRKKQLGTLIKRDGKLRISFVFTSLEFIKERARPDSDEFVWAVVLAWMCRN